MIQHGLIVHGNPSSCSLSLSTESLVIKDSRFMDNLYRIPILCTLLVYSPDYIVSRRIATILNILILELV